MDTTGHDAMNGAALDDDDVMFQYDDEDDRPVRIVAPLPREVLEWMCPDNKALVDLNCHMKLSSNAPYIGLRNGCLEQAIIYDGQEPGPEDEMGSVPWPVVYATEELMGEMDPSAAFTLTVRDTRIVADSDADSFSVHTMKPGPWFRRVPKPDHDEPKGPAEEPPAIIYDDSGDMLRLQQPSTQNYFAAITAQQADDKNALKIGHCPYEADNNDDQDPFHLGPTVSWAPYFLNDMPSAGSFEPEKCLVGGAEQIPLPFIRCLYETDSPLALPYRGQHHDFLPTYRTRQRRGMPRKCLGEASKDPVRETMGLSEYNTLTGRYKDWNRLLIGLEMIRGQQNRGYFEAAATGLLAIVHFLARNLELFGLLPDSEGHNSGIRVSPEDRTAFWYCVREMLDRVLHQQAISMDHIVNGRFDLIPRKASSAETPLAGQPFRQPGMLPENWWIFGREVDRDWSDFFRDHFWGGSILETDMFVPVPAHFCSATQTSPTDAATDTEMVDEEPAAEGLADSSHHHSRTQPLNIVAQFTMDNLREVMNQMYWVLYGIPGEAPVAGSNDYFSKDEYHYLYRLAANCCRDLKGATPDQLPSSRYSNQKMLRYAGRKYKHPIEEFSV